jgi:hypothetical protein
MTNGTPTPGKPFAFIPTGLNPQQLMQMALTGAVPRFYANHCGVAQTPTDLALILINNSVPVATINLSYETAKFITEQLTNAVSKYEEAAGQSIKGVVEMIDKLKPVTEGS